MASVRFRVVLVAACLAAVGGGCHSMTPAPDAVALRADGPRADLSSRPAPGRYYDPTLAQATAEEPVVPGPSPDEALAAATGNSRVRLKDEKKKDDDFFDPGGWIDNASKSIKAWTGHGPSEEIARKAFEDGKELFAEKRYEEAAKQFAEAAARWPKSALEEDSLFLLGESYFFCDRYPDAHEAYETLLKKYEFSRHVNRAAAREFAMGRYWEQVYRTNPRWVTTPNFTDKTQPTFDTWGHAMKAYEHVRMNDPGGPLADHAVMATANANFIEGRYEEAARFYDMLRKDYPKSEHQLNAHLLALEAKQHVYQGSMYDGTPLKEINEIADQTLLRFGRQLSEADRNRVLDVKNRVVEEQATRQWSVGQYYDKNAYYGSARIYYQAVVDAYPQTKSAQWARRRLEEIKDRPAEPVNHFKWLTYVFEPNKDRR